MIHNAPPENLYPATTAATYISLKITHPDKDITIKNNEDKSRTFYIGQAQQIDIPSLEDLIYDVGRYGNYWVPIIQKDNKKITLRIDEEYSFNIMMQHSTSDYHHNNQDELSTLQKEIEKALGNLKNLQRYGFLFNKEKFNQHLDYLAKRFPKETKGIAESAREIGINTISTAYLNELSTKEDSFLGVPYSKLKRTGILTGGALGLAGLIRAMPGTEQLGQIYNDLLFNYGPIATTATNVATMAFYYLLGDSCAQFIEWKGFDQKRLLKMTGLGAVYGAELTGVYWVINHINLDNRLLSSLAKGVVDVGGYAILVFNPKHIYLMSKEKLNPLDYIRFDKMYSLITKDHQFRKKWEKLNYFSSFGWLPYQLWNRYSHALQQQVYHVCRVLPVFTVFISLVSNEKKELDEFMKVMALLKTTP